MALLSFPWDLIGYPTDLEITDICNSISHPYNGYSASRATSGKIQKLFAHTWIVTTDQWIAFVEFWRSVYGNVNAFYYQFPVELYGSPGYGGYGGTEPPDGFDADQPVGYGEGPILTVRFAEKQLPQKYRTNFPGTWSVQASMREVA